MSGHGLAAALLCWSVLAHPVRAIDGDTFDVLVETWLGFGKTAVLTPERVRVLGINTPERGQPGYAEATAFTAAWLAKGDVALLTCGRDSFGRVLATVTRGTENLTEQLLDAGYVPYVPK